MKPKNLIILIVVLVVLAGIAYFVVKPQTPEKRADRMGELLFEKLPLNDVAAIRIDANSDGQLQEVTLKSAEDGWVVDNRFDYPADFKAISGMVAKFKEAKIGRSFTPSPEAVSRLGLNPPDKADAGADEKAVRIRFLDKASKPLTDVLVGKPRETDTGGGGHYLKLADQDTAFLVDQSLDYLDKKPAEWLEKSLLDVKADTVETVSGFDPEAKEPKYMAKRPEKGKPPELVQPSPKEMPQDKKLKTQTVNSLFGALASLRIEDVAGPLEKVPGEKTGFDSDAFLKFRLYDGTVYTVYPGNKVENAENKYYLKIEVGYEASEKPAAASESEAAADKPEIAETTPKPEIQPDPAAQKEETAPDPAEIKYKASEQNEKLSKWAYVISEWKYKALVTDPEAFFEIKEDPKKDEQS